MGSLEMDVSMRVIIGSFIFTLILHLSDQHQERVLTQSRSLPKYSVIKRSEGHEGLYNIEMMVGEDEDVRVLNYLRSLTSSKKKSKAESVSGFFRFTK